MTPQRAVEKGLHDCLVFAISASRNLPLRDIEGNAVRDALVSSGLRFVLLEAIECLYKWACRMLDCLVKKCSSQPTTSQQCFRKSFGMEGCISLALVCVFEMRIQS